MPNFSALELARNVCLLLNPDDAKQMQEALFAIEDAPASRDAHARESARRLACSIYNDLRDSEDNAPKFLPGSSPEENAELLALFERVQCNIFAALLFGIEDELHGVQAFGRLAFIGQEALNETLDAQRLGFTVRIDSAYLAAQCEIAGQEYDARDVAMLG